MLMPTFLSAWKMQSYMFKEMLGGVSFRVGWLIGSHQLADFVGLFG